MQTAGLIQKGKFKERAKCFSQPSIHSKLAYWVAWQSLKGLDKKKHRLINHSFLYSLCQDKHSTACVFDYNYRGNYFTMHNISEKRQSTCKGHYFKVWKASVIDAFFIYFIYAKFWFTKVILRQDLIIGHLSNLYLHLGSRHFHPKQLTNRKHCK